VERVDEMKTRQFFMICTILLAIETVIVAVGATLIEASEQIHRDNVMLREALRQGNALQLEANYECAQFNGHGIWTEQGIYCYRMEAGTDYFIPLERLKEANRQPSDGLDT